MKKLISIILVCVCLAVLVMGCSLFESPVKESTQTQNQSEVQASVPHQKSTVGILPYVSLGLNVLCIFCIVLCFRMIINLRWKIQEKEDRSSKLGNRHTQVQPPPTNMKMEIDNALKGYKLPSSEVNNIVNEVMKCLGDVQRVQSQINAPKQSVNNDYMPINSMPIAKKKLYASQWNVNNNSFYSVLESPNDNTIYELEVNENSAEFGLFSGAIAKVIVAPDFLTHASDVQRMRQDPYKARTDTKGRAILKSGNWSIETKARIIFE